jgi:hypothetical protein
VIGADDFQVVGTSVSQRPEVIVWIDEVAGRCVRDVARANGSHDHIGVPDEQSATLTRRFLACVREHVRENQGRDPPVVQSANLRIRQSANSLFFCQYVSPDIRRLEGFLQLVPG